MKFYLYSFIYSNTKNGREREIEKDSEITKKKERERKSEIENERERGAQFNGKSTSKKV